MYCINFAARLRSVELGKATTHPRGGAGNAACKPTNANGEAGRGNSAADGDSDLLNNPIYRAA
jgi:hypothetical protein